MMKILPLNPILNFQSFYATEMLNVVCHHSETGNFGSTPDKEVVILNGCTQTLEPEFFLAESINSVSKGDHFHLAEEILKYECLQ